MHFIDNTVAQSALVHGYRPAWTGRHLQRLTSRRLACAWRCTSTMCHPANIADLFLRGEFAVPRALGQVVSMRVLRTRCAGPPALEAWLERGLEHGER